MWEGKNPSTRKDAIKGRSRWEGGKGRGVTGRGKSVRVREWLTTHESFFQMNFGILHGVGVGNGRRRQRSSHVVYSQQKQHAARKTQVSTRTQTHKTKQTSTCNGAAEEDSAATTARVTRRPRTLRTVLEFQLLSSKDFSGTTNCFEITFRIKFHAWKSKRHIIGYRGIRVLTITAINRAYTNCFYRVNVAVGLGLEHCLVHQWTE